MVSNIASNAVSNSIDNFEWRLSGKGTAWPGKEFTWFISNEGMDDIIVKLLQNSGVLIDGITETVKHKIKKTRRWTS